MPTVRVFGETIKWARLHRNLSVDAAAKLLKIKPVELRAIESGQASPTATVFRRMARKYYFPEATLVLKQPPKLPPPPKDFRTIEGRAAEMSYETSVVVDRTRAYQRGIAELASADQELVTVTMPAYTVKDPPRSVAFNERQRLGVDVQQQLDWYDADDAFRKWRRIIEATGVAVYMEAFPWDDCKGFSIRDVAVAPAIVINKNEPLAVGKVFSLMHEYCHLLIARPGLSDRDYENPTEAYCNRFASAFLMPLEALHSVLPHWPSEAIEWDRAVIVQAARALHVSQQALAIRLEELGLAVKGSYAQFKEQQKRSEPVRVSPRGTPGYTVLRIYDLGRHYTGTVLTALRKEYISPIEASMLLNTPPHLFDKMRKRLSI